MVDEAEVVALPGGIYHPVSVQHTEVEVVVLLQVLLSHAFLTLLGNTENKLNDPYDRALFILVLLLCF